MPADPRLLRLRIQRLMQHGSSKAVEIADLVKQADELAQSLPPENTCRDNTWTTLRSSGLLEELAVMVTTLPGVLPRPAAVEVRWLFACISALYHTFQVMDIDLKQHGRPELKLAERCELMISRYVHWFGSSSEDWPGLARSRRQILLLVYRLSNHEEKIDESFVRLIDFDDMVSVILANIFDPLQVEEPCQRDNSVIWAGCHILSIYGKTRGFFNTTAEDNVKRYGADLMARQCAAIIEGIPPSVPMLVHVSSLVQYILFAPSSHKNIIEKWHLHLRLVKRWWETERTRSQVSLDQSFFFSDLRALLDAISPKTLQRSAMRDLVQEQDLILLLGRGSIAREILTPPVLSGELAKPFYDLAIQHCRDDTLLMATHVKTIWLYVLDCLRLLKRCADPLWESLRNEKKLSEVDVWRAFGYKLGLSEGAVRQEQAQARKKDSKDLVGCFFLKCPLYGEDINYRVESPLRCTGCKLAQYCSIPCQKLHWRHDHKSHCGPYASTPSPTIATLPGPSE